MLKHRDIIISTLKSFAALPATKALVKQYLHHVNIEYEKHKPQSTPATPGTGGHRKSSVNPNAKSGDRRMSSVSKTKVAAVTAVTHHKNATFGRSVCLLLLRISLPNPSLQ